MARGAYCAEIIVDNDGLSYDTPVSDVATAPALMWLGGKTRASATPSWFVQCPLLPAS